MNRSLIRGSLGFQPKFITSCILYILEPLAEQKRVLLFPLHRGFFSSLEYQSKKPEILRNQWILWAPSHQENEASSNARPVATVFSRQAPRLHGRESFYLNGEPLRLSCQGPPLPCID